MPKPTHLYRPEIDGLRALAVLAVLFYHLVPEWLPGGFIGVNVFFVISGFLITQQIKESLIHGTFSFSRFFERRARRIFPALLAVLLACSAISVVALTPDDVMAFAHALWASLLFVSNGYFWLNTRYFDSTSITKPLLHTWSLAVEMQFYLLWPMILLALHRYVQSSRIPLIIGSIIALSYAASEWMITADGNAVFYLLPFRAFELAIGAMLAYLPAAKPKPVAANNALCLSGFSLILAIAILAPPLLNAWLYNLLPCLGAAMILYAGSAAPSSIALTNRFMRTTGVISYSLYLVHWPLIAFYKYLGLSLITLPVALILAAMSWGLAWLLYRFVETPFRHRRNSTSTSRSFWVGTITITAVLAAAGLTIHLQQGMKWRIDASRMATAPTFEKDFGIGDFSYFTVNTLGDASAPPSFILIGDSFAGQYAYGLHSLLAQHHRSAISYAIPACFFTEGYTVRDQGQIITDCDKAYHKMLALTANNSLPVVFAFNWKFYSNNLLDANEQPVHFRSQEAYTQFVLQKLQTYRRILGASRKIMIVGLAPDLTPNDVWSRCSLMPQWLPSGCNQTATIPRSTYQLHNSYNALLESFVEAQSNTQFINPMDAFCDATTCTVTTPSAAYFFDTWHLSRVGSVHVTNYFAPIFIEL
jgi:peptidoglycan/LPS O-acetylase OafA/YrhL